MIDKKWSPALEKNRFNDLWAKRGISFEIKNN